MIKVSTTKSILALPPTTMTTIRRRLIRASSSSSSSSSSALAVMSNGEDLVRALRLVVTTHRSSPTLESSSPRRYRRINLQRLKQRADQWESPFATARVGVPTVVVPMLPSPISVSVSSSTLQSSSNVNILPSESLASLVGMEKDVILDNNPRVGDYSNKDEFDIRNSKSNSGNSSNNIGFLPNSPKHRKDQQSSLRIAPSKQEVGQRRQNPKMSEEGEWKWPPRRDNQQQEPQGYTQQEQHQLQQQQKQQQQGRIIQQKNRNRGAIRNKQQPTYERSQTQYPQQNDPNRQQRQLQPYREEDTLERTLISYTRQLQRRLHDLRLYLQEHGHPTPQRNENQQQPTQSRQQQQQQQQQRHDRQQPPPYDPNDNQKHRQNNNNKNSDIQQQHHHHHRRLHHKLEDKIDQTLNGILRTMSDMQLVDSSRSSSDTHNDVDMNCGINKKGMEKGTTLTTTTIKTTTVGELATLLHDFCVIFAEKQIDHIQERYKTPHFRNPMSSFLSHIMPTPRLVSETAEWKRLKRHAEYITDTHLRDLLQDSERCEAMYAQHDGVYLDYSRQRATLETMDYLLDLAEKQDLKGKMNGMVTGEKINFTEDRAVLHTALRAGRDQIGTIFVDGMDVVKEIHDVLDQIKYFTETVRSGIIRGYTGKRLRNVISVGIGGSYLGPEFLHECLKTETEGINSSLGYTLRFLSNVDPVDVERGKLIIIG